MKSKVVFISDDLEDAYDILPENDFLKKAIRNAAEELTQNAYAGIQIQKRLFPKE